MQLGRGIWGLVIKGGIFSFCKTGAKTGTGKHFSALYTQLVSRVALAAMKLSGLRLCGLNVEPYKTCETASMARWPTAD